MKYVIADTINWWKKNKIKVSILLMLNILIGVCLCAGIVYYLFPKVTIKQTILQTEQVTVSGESRIFVMYDNKNPTDSCPRQVNLKLWTWFQLSETEKVPVAIIINNQTVSSASLGSEKYIISFAVPMGIWQGDWFLSSQFEGMCSIVQYLIHGRNYENVNVPIRIENVTGEPPDIEDIIKMPRN